MIKPRAFDFYNLSTYLRPLMFLRGGLYLSGNREVIGIFTHANIGLCLFRGDAFANKYLPQAREKAEDFYKFIQEEFTRLDQPWDQILIQGKVDNLHKYLTGFETTLADELSKAPVFCCEEDLLGNLSIDKLLAGASNGYSGEVKKRMDFQCSTEVDESGRCLVYERPTASGFHILRAIELMILAYLQSSPGFVMPPINRQNWGEYISALRLAGADKKTTDHIQNLKDNHRNPLMHPRDSLTIPEAVSLFAVGQSTIETLVADGIAKGIFS